MVYKMFIIRMYIQTDAPRIHDMFEDTVDLFAHGLFEKKAEGYQSFTIITGGSLWPKNSSISAPNSATRRSAASKPSCRFETWRCCKAEIEIVNSHPVMTGLLHSMSGLLAILDEHRQIVALNDSFLKMLEIDDSSEALGLRTGVALELIHAHEEPAGCGTTKYCSTCGAAVAISVSLGQDKPVERICTLTAKRNDILVDVSLLIRATPIRIDEKRFLLLFIQDITLQQQLAALERTFFHDISNMLGGLLGANEMLVLKDRDSKLAKTIYSSALRLTQKIRFYVTSSGWFGTKHHTESETISIPVLYVHKSRSLPGAAP